MIHTLDNSAQQRNLMKAHALFQLAVELILDNADYEASTILEDLQEIGDFVETRIDDRLLAMNNSFNPYLELMRKSGMPLLNGPNSVNANVADVLVRIRGTEFQKEEEG